MAFVLYNLALFLCGACVFPKKIRSGVLWGIGLGNLVFALFLWQKRTSFFLTLRGTAGITLFMDELSRVCIVTMAVVWCAVSISLAQKNVEGFFAFLLVVFLGAGNLLFVSFDLFNIYVLLELLTLLVFLLAGKTGSTPAFWAAMKYLLLATVAMNVYLLGVGMVFARTGSLQLGSAPIEGVPAGCIAAGLLGKAGIFLFSMWLVNLHSRVASDISALLSGAAVKTGVYALLRVLPFLAIRKEYIAFFGLCSALLGVFFAFHEREYKRMLAYSTLSQIGYILAVPEAGYLSIFAHGVYKAWLFLGATLLSSQELPEVKRQGLAFPGWLFLALPALAMAGLPFTSGALPKELLLESATWQRPVLYGASAGTAALFARVFLLPWRWQWEFPRESIASHVILSGFSFFPLFGWGQKHLEALCVLGAGVLIHRVFANRLKTLPRVLELFDNAMLLYIVLLAFLVMVSVHG